MNPILDHFPRGVRRQLLDKERKHRRRGDWGAWERIDLSGGTGLRGWAAKFHTAHKNHVFSVLERTLPTGETHLMVTSLSGERPTWYELQRIKNELAGANATGVEIYPPQDQLVDGADAYHLWIVPGGLPFGLKTEHGG